MTMKLVRSDESNKTILIAKLIIMVSLLSVLLFDVNPQTTEGAAGSGKALTGIVQIAGNHALDKNGMLWSWDETKYTAVPILQNVKQISSSQIAVKEDGSVWVWGMQRYSWINHEGLFSGIGSTFQQPTQIKGLPVIEQVSGNYWNTYAIDTKGNVWEINGVDHNAKQVEGLKNIIELDVNTYQSALDKDGNVWTWGLDRFGHPFGPFHNLTNIKSITGGLAVGHDWSMTEIYSDIRYYGIGKLLVDLRPISKTITAVSGAFVESRSDYSFLLQNNGTVWTLINAYTASDRVILQQVKELANVTDISAKGMGGGTALHRDGTVSSWSGAQLNKTFSDRFYNSESMVGFPIKPVKVMAGIGIKVNGSLWALPTQPQMFNNRVYIPVRGLFESLGGRIGLTDKLVTIEFGQRRVVLEIGTAAARIDGKSVKLDDLVRVENGRTMVPFRFIGEALGANIKWDGVNQTVELTIQEL